MLNSVNLPTVKFKFRCYKFLPVGSSDTGDICYCMYILYILTAVVDILLQQGVSIDSVDSKGCTPLIVAAQYGKIIGGIRLRFCHINVRKSARTHEAGEYFTLKFVDLTLLFHDLPIRKVGLVKFGHENCVSCFI